MLEHYRFKIILEVRVGVGMGVREVADIVIILEGMSEGQHIISLATITLSIIEIFRFSLLTIRDI